jgi:hypothetical protein
MATTVAALRYLPVAQVEHTPQPVDQSEPGREQAELEPKYDPIE